MPRNVIHRVQDGEDWFFSTDQRRCVVVRPFGIACYECSPPKPNGQVVFWHQEVVGTEDDADRWLNYEQPSKLLKVH